MPGACIGICSIPCCPCFNKVTDVPDRNDVKWDVFHTTICNICTLNMEIIKPNPTALPNHMIIIEKGAKWV